MNRKRSSLFLTLTACGALSIGLIGCGSGGGYSKPPSTMPPYTSPAHSLLTPVNNPGAPGTTNSATAPAAQAQAAR